MKNTLHPEWPMFTINSNTLCNSDESRNILVMCVCVHLYVCVCSWFHTERAGGAMRFLLPQQVPQNSQSQY